MILRDMTGVARIGERWRTRKVKGERDTSINVS